MNDDIHTLTGAYVLDALSETERRRFELHVSRCSGCAEEVAELRDTAARLGSVAAVQPPAELRARVLSAVAKTRQLPPDTSDHARPEPEPSADAGTGAGAAEPPRLSVLPGRARWQRRIGALAAAAAVLLVVGVGVVEVQSNRQMTREVEALREVSADYREFADMLAAPDTRLVRGSVTGGGTGTAVVSPSRGAVMFVAHGLPELPADRDYQLWVIDDDGPHPAGLLASAAQGRPLLVEGVDGSERVGLTVEPRGGSPEPTTPTVVVLPLV